MGLKRMSLFSQRSESISQRSESIISFIDCLMVEKAEPDSSRESTMRGLQATDQI